jgi:hypothetical protein
MNNRALAIWEGTAGREHPDVAYALQGLGDTHLAAGRPADAIAPLERALTIRAAGSVPDDLAETRFALARALWDAGRDRPRARTLAGGGRGRARRRDRQGRRADHSPRMARITPARRAMIGCSMIQEAAGALDRPRSRSPNASTASRGLTRWRSPCPHESHG